MPDPTKSDPPAKPPVLLPTPGVPAHFNIDQAIKHELDKVPPGDWTKAVVITGEKVAGGPAKARIALVLKNDLGEWDMETKVYGEVGEHIKPTVGVQVVLTK